MATLEQLNNALNVLGIEDKYTLKELAILHLQRFCCAELKKVETDKCKRIVKNAADSSNEAIRLLVEAFNHFKTGEKPTTERLAYQLANIYGTYRGELKSAVETDEDKRILRDVLSQFDVVDYVFTHTHYDECSNGFFFRRS